MIAFFENRKVWSFHYLKIEKLREIHFMFLIDMKFISKLLQILSGKLNIFRSSSSWNKIKMIYSKIKRKTNEKHMVCKPSRIFEISDVQIYKNNISPGGSHVFLYFLKHFWYNKMSKCGLPGLRESRNHQNVKFWCLK